MSTTRADDFATPAPLSLAASLPLLLVLGASVPVAGVPAAVIATVAMVAVRADPLAITLPNSVNLGGANVGGTFSASLGTVTVVDSRPGIPPWTATVSATDFTTGGSPVRTITKDNIAYWSGPTTASSGSSNRTPGQATATQKVPLTTPAVAFRARKGVGATSTSWEPTLVITVPATAAAGVYTGVISHSVA